MEAPNWALSCKIRFEKSFPIVALMLCVCSEDFKDWRGSIFQRLGKRWAVAFKADLYTEEPRQYAVGGQYQINDNSLLKATVRDNGFLGLVYQLNLTENIGITYHVGLELKDPIKGEHRVGISCSLRA